MPNPFSKGWNYFKSSLDNKIEENADPQIQINQAVEAAKKQHQQITDQAAVVIGQQHQLEGKLNRLLADQERVQGQARQAIQMADKSRAEGDNAKAQEYEQAAEILATQLVSIEQQLEETTTLHRQAQNAAEQAKAQQRESQAKLEQQLSDLEQLRTQAVQADMQTKATQALDQTRAFKADDSTPTLDSVREKIERRYAQALGAQELAQGSLGENIAQYEKLDSDFKASARLDQLRAELKANDSAKPEELEAPQGKPEKPQQDAPHDSEE